MKINPRHELSTLKNNKKRYFQIILVNLCLNTHYAMRLQKTFSW